ncbi:MAG: putative DNA-binding protein (MmcQ/YjbR family) [Thalassolituus sp.]|jgi:predicted DNA-binding protein (MmcQ/YjbR family)
MDASALIQYLSSKPEAVLEYPFGPEAEVFKISGKMFALVMHRDNVTRVNLKCDPLEAIQLRDIFDGVTPGYHMNKKHWNTVLVNDSIPSGEIERMIDASYQLVVKSLTKNLRLGLEARFGAAVLYPE